MAGQLYALLVGIDTYPPNLNSLSGCVNDITRVGDFLNQRATSPQVKPLTNQSATRANVIDGWEQHLSQAGPDDVALFYYSGHGGQSIAPQEFWPVEPDHLLEGIVCYDSRLGAGIFDLTDKELGKLIAGVAARGPQVVVVLDCCHSGTGTRDGAQGIRRAPTDDRPRPLDSFLIAPTTRSLDPADSGWDPGPANHILLAACRAEEESKEIPLDGQQRGVFSYFLLEALQQVNNGALSYRDLMASTTARVRSCVPLQWPQLEAFGFDIDREFLGGALPPRPPYAIVGWDPVDEWVIDAGAVHGIPPVAGAETTKLALFPRGAAAGPLDIAASLGEASVTEVLPATSKVALQFKSLEAPDQSQTFDAIVVSLPLPPMAVRLTGTKAGTALARTALHASLFVAEGAAGEFTLEADHGRFRILRAGELQPLVADLAGLTAANALLAVQRLDHLARWTRLSSLSNPLTALGQAPVTLELFEADGVTPLTAGAGAVALSYANGKTPQIKIKLTNTTEQKLWCMLLDLNESFGVYTGLIPGGGYWVDAKAELWAYGNQPIPVTVPDALAAQGFTSINDQLKLIVSTAAADPSSLEENDLALPPKGATRGPGEPLKSTLDRLMDRIATRHMGGDAAEPLADWTTSELAIVTQRPADSVTVPAAGGKASLATGVVLEGHDALAGARARIATAPDAARDVTHPPLPPILLDGGEPLELGVTTRGRPGASVLELEFAGAVPELEEPLVLRLGRELADDEHVLPIAWDGEFYLPLGRGRGDAVLIERLPQPTGTRALGTTIKILLRKVVGRKLGLPYEYPVLSAVDGAYEADPAKVAERVAAAERIVLFVHGLTGDTRTMISGAHGADLVLAFDYESFNTPVEETARALKQRLAAVGLGSGHGKTLQVVGHSLGGLVARWFVEREGGNAVVSRLVLVGTPNTGSPWPTIQAWATAAVGIAINGLAITIWPATALAALLALIERMDTGVDAMAPGSTVLGSLAASTDPAVAYATIGGNTSIIAGAPIDRLLAKLEVPTRKVLGLAFFGMPNDTAVSVSSATTLPWAQTSREVACDHVSYFRSPSGLDALAEALTI